MRATWLPDVLRAAGLPVIELAGWRGRGGAMSGIHAVIWHDTVTGPATSDSRVAALLRDGHSTLVGPLSQLGLDRQGRFWVIADGRCNHNGYGRWGNNAIGIEVFCGGGGIPGRVPQEPYNAAQREAVARGTAAINARLGLDASRNLGHRESDPGRKIDPFGVDTAALRRRTTEFMQPPSKEWDDMATREEVKAAVLEAFDDAVFLAEWQGKQYIVREVAQTATHITTGAEFDKLRRAFPHKGSRDVTTEYEVIA